MRLERRFTRAGESPFEGMAFRAGDSEIRNPDGTIVFQQRGIEVPAAWSQVATDVLAQKYFRRAGVARRLKKVAEADVPEWLWRSVPDEAAARPRQRSAARPARARFSTAWPAPGPTGAGRAATSTARPTPAPSTTSTASCWRRRWPRRTRRSGSTPACTGPTASTVRARATGTSTIATARPTSPTSAYERPQPHACFIQGVADDLVNDGGIMDLWVREARLFKYGSGTGSNFSQHPRRGREALGRRQVVGPDVLPQDRRPRGGRHQVGRHDAARGQDGRGRHRPSRHRGVRLLEDARGAEGRRAGRRLEARQPAPQRHHAGAASDGFEPKQNPRLRREIVAARRAEMPENYIQRVIQFARQGYRHIEFPTFDTDWQSEAYATVSGQNANNSVRVTDDFLKAVAEDREWALTARTTGKVDQDGERARRCGTASPRPPGTRPIRACSSTPPSTTGTPARSPAGSTPPIRARSTCSSTTRPAISPR